MAKSNFCWLLRLCKAKFVRILITILFLFRPLTIILIWRLHKELVTENKSLRGRKKERPTWRRTRCSVGHLLRAADVMFSLTLSHRVTTLGILCHYCYTLQLNRDNTYLANFFRPKRKTHDKLKKKISDKKNVHSDPSVPVFTCVVGGSMGKNVLLLSRTCPILYYNFSRVLTMHDTRDTGQSDYPKA